MQGVQVAVGEVDTSGVVNLAVDIYPVVGGKTVFGHHDRELVALVEEAWAPIKSFRAHRPFKRGEGETFRAFYSLRFAVCSSTENFAVVDVGSVEVDRLLDNGPIGLGHFRQVFPEDGASFFRIITKD